MTVKNSAYIVLLLLLVIVGVGMFLAIRSPNQDVYLFSSWSLYHIVPGNITEFAVLIYEHEGELFDSPIFFQDAHEHKLLKENDSPTAYWKVIQRLGANLEEGQEEQIRSERTRLENNFRSRNIRYEVIKISYDPLEYWQSREFEVVKRLGQFIPSKPSS